jgi:hypothetical protein
LPAAGRIGFQRDPSPQTSHSWSIPWYDWFMGPIADAIMAIVVAILSKDLADSVSAKVGAVAVFQQIPQFVAWSGLDALAVTGASFDDALCLRGRTG